MKRRIKLTENMLREMVRNTISKELSRIDEAKHNYGKYIRRAIYDYLVKNGKVKKIWDMEHLSDEQVNNIIADMPQVRDIEKKFLGNFMHGYSNYKDPIKRLAPIFVRLALENDWGKFTQNDDVIRGLRKILRFILNRFKNGGGDAVIKTDYDEEGNVVKNYYLRDIPNNITYEDLKNMCSGAFNSNGTSGNSDLKIEDIDYSNSNGYDIEANITFERAHEIGKLSGDENRNCRLCYTTSEDTWNNYTNSGENTVYVLLKKGYEDMHPNDYTNHEDRPYDPYGLSMIFLFVDPNGELVHSNVRWNHIYEELGGNRTDENFTKTEIDRITGLSFDDHFINVWKKDPNLTKIENVLAGNEQEDADSQKLFTWEPLEGSNEKYSIIKLTNQQKVNIYDNVNKRFLFSKWFAGIRELVTGNLNIKRYAVKTDAGDCNILTPEGKLLFEGPPVDWPSSVGHFNGGFSIFYLDDIGGNYIDLNGNILYEPDNQEEWFYKCDTFNEYGLARVQVDGDRYNYINKNGEIVYNPDDRTEWFEYCDSFYNGFAKVELNGLYNFLNHNGDVVYEPYDPYEWFDECGEFYEGFAIVKKGDYYNFLSEDGEILYRRNNPYEWFDSCESFDRRGVADVEKDEKLNLLKPNGELVSPNLWFDTYSYYTENFFRVWIGEEIYLMDINGNFYDPQTYQPIPIPNGDNTAYESIERLKNKIRRFVNEAINIQDEWNKRFFGYVEQAVSEIQEGYLSKLGLTVKLEYDYDFEDNPWLAAYLSSQGQIENGIIPIALNTEHMYQIMVEEGIADDETELEAQAYVSIGHEVGHGIVDYLINCYDGENEIIDEFIHDYYDGEIDEEELVEEFGEYMIPGITGQWSSDLADILGNI